MTEPDSDRTALYEAEAAAFIGTDLETVIGVAAVISLIEEVVSTQWWPGPPVVGRPARSDALSSSARIRCGVDGVTIRVAAGQATRATVAHELAHALAGVSSGHDPIFRKAYLDVVTVLTNVDSRDRRRQLHGDQLRSAFAAFELAVGERRWPPPIGYGEAIAL